MDRSLPSFFRRGPSERTRAIFFSVLAIAVLTADWHGRYLYYVRAGLATLLYPLQQISSSPASGFAAVQEFFTSHRQLQDQAQRAQTQSAQLQQWQQQGQALQLENQQLRRLLQVREQERVQTQTAQVLYQTRDPYSRRLVLDRGALQNVQAGSPVMDGVGILGQITRVFPLVSEVTLITDKDQTIPVQVLRNGLRSVAYGGAEAGMLDLRFMAANADIQTGDTLVTSGLDGLYPPGLPVARVSRVEKKSTDAFGRIVCEPLAGVEQNRHFLIVTPLQATPLPREMQATFKNLAPSASPASANTLPSTNKSP